MITMPITVERLWYLSECRQVEMFVWQIEYDTGVDRFVRMNEKRRVLQRYTVRLDHNLQQPANTKRKMIHIHLSHSHTYDTILVLTARTTVL